MKKKIAVSSFLIISLLASNVVVFADARTEVLNTAPNNEFALIEKSSTASEKLISTRSISDTEMFGDWKLVRTLGSTSIPYTNKNISKGEFLRSAINTALAGVPLVNMIGASERVYNAYCVDTGALGGVYTKTFYLRKIIDPSTANANVPVPYAFQVMTVFYKSSDMRPQNAVYIERMSDGIRSDVNR